MFENEWMKRGLAAGLGALLVLVAVLLTTAGAAGDADDADALGADEAAESGLAGADPDIADAVTDAVTAGLDRPSGVVRIVEGGGGSSSPAPGDDGPSDEGTSAPAPPQPAADNEKPVLYHDSITRHGYIVQVRGIAEDPDGAITHFTVDWGDGLVETFAPYFNEGYQKPGMKASRNFDPDDVEDQSRNVVVKVYDDQGAYVAFTETVNF